MAYPSFIRTKITVADACRMARAQIANPGYKGIDDALEVKLGQDCPVNIRHGLQCFELFVDTGNHCVEGPCKVLKLIPAVYDHP